MLKEYAGLIKLILAGLLAGGLFIGGCTVGKNSGEAERENLAGQVASLQTANESFVAIEERRKKEVELAQKRAEEWKAAADAAEQRVSAARRAKEQAEKAARDAIGAAYKDPDCKKLLESVCEVLPMP